MVDNLYSQGLTLKETTQVAQRMLQGQEISKYIETKVNPLLSTCGSFTSQAEAALTSARTALQRSRDSFSLATQTASAITALSSNIQNMPKVNLALLAQLRLKIQEIRARYATMGLESTITRLRRAAATQKTKLDSYRMRKGDLERKIEDYKVLHSSLGGLSCR